MKKNRAKGRWLRQIGRVGRPTEKNAFADWINKDNKYLTERGDIRYILTDLKPRLIRYLAGKGFKAKKNISFGEWHRSTEKTVLLLREAYDVEPIAYALWCALNKIEEIEAALSAGDMARACAGSFRLGRLMQEADAHSAMERRTKKAGMGNENHERTEAMKHFKNLRLKLGAKVFNGLKPQEVEKEDCWFTKVENGQNNPRFSGPMFRSILRDFKKNVGNTVGDA